MARKAAGAGASERPAAPATLYLKDTAGPPIRRDDALRAGPAFWRVDRSAAEAEGRRLQPNAMWEWRIIERVYVEGWELPDGSREFPTLEALGRASGCDREVIKTRAGREGWYDKRKVHEERLPALVEDAAARHVARHLAPWIASIREAMGGQKVREILRNVTEPYVARLIARLTGEDPESPEILPNVADAEKLLRLLAAVEGEATERVVLVGTVQANINMQARATREALDEAVAAGLLEEHALPAILELVEVHVARVRWRYRVEPSDLDAEG